MKKTIQLLGTKIRRIGWLLLLVLLPLYLVVCVGCAAFQRKLIYFPPVMDTATADRMAAGSELERWTNSAGQTVGWQRLSPVQPAQGRVLLLHGNAGAAIQCGHYAEVIQQVAAFDVFIVEYPGYADLPGQPTEQALYRAAEDALQLLATNAPIYLVGESLGTGVAAYLAGKHSDQIAGVVLLAPYTRLVDVAQAHYPFLPVRLLLRDRFPAEDHLRRYRGPVAVLVSGWDLVVPARFGRLLYAGYAGPKKLWEFPRGHHGTVMTQPPETWRQVVDFWRSHPASRERHLDDSRPTAGVH